jgi:hypothetical protein
MPYIDIIWDLDDDMANQGRDLSRGRKLTAAEAADYANIRRQVAEEIPPAKTNVVRQVIAKLRQVRRAGAQPCRHGRADGNDSR